MQNNLKQLKANYPENLENSRAVPFMYELEGCRHKESRVQSLGKKITWTLDGVQTVSVRVM